MNKVKTSIYGEEKIWPYFKRKREARKKNARYDVICIYQGQIIRKMGKIM